MHDEAHAFADLAAVGAAGAPMPAPAFDPGPAIPRKPRLVMRDPQQTAHEVNSFELPTFAFAEGRNAADEAARIVEEARATAAQMLEQTRAKCEGELEAARARGYEEGLRDGSDRADAEAANLVATAEQIAVHTAQERERLLAQAEGDVVELAIAIARRMVNATIDIDPALVVEVCRGAMRRAFQREVLTVLAHPDDLQLLREAGPQLAGELGGIQQLDFVEERRLDRGSVIVRTPAGEIDATFSGKSAVIEQALRELVAERMAEWRSGRAA